MRISHSEAWVLDGIDPSSEESYYQWAPSASDCPFYEDNKEAYLIERGDVLRVEGIKSLLADPAIKPNVTSSIEFIEDFTVTEVQNFYYSSSAFSPDVGDLLIGSSPLTSNIVGGTYELDGLTSSTAPAASTFSFTVAPVGGATGTAAGGRIRLTPIATNKNGIWSTKIIASNMVIKKATFPFNDGTGYTVGDVITITDTNINTAFGSTNTNDLVITLNSNMVAGGISNDLTALVDYNAGCTPTIDFGANGYIHLPKG